MAPASAAAAAMASASAASTASAAADPAAGTAELPTATVSGVVPGASTASCSPSTVADTKMPAVVTFVRLDHRLLLSRGRAGAGGSTSSSGARPWRGGERGMTPWCVQLRSTGAIHRRLLPHCRRLRSPRIRSPRTRNPGAESTFSARLNTEAALAAEVERTR
ncbi:hypothetical protein D4765_08650 [Subtercola vilae]|uniref:Secreted protein n=1 Tax=Subtercola vilae TaxID=2056433 RepID=A0A4T2BYM5_9MICO|nr:hypothetical protein D4765_08650 [Subtercola vilae]